MSHLPEFMRAARISAFGGVEMIEVERVGVPSPGPGQVLVALRAAGVGPWDALVREGRSGLPQSVPLTLGADGAGIVVRLGEGITGFAEGDAVFGASNDRFVGCNADFALFDAGRLALKPPDVGFLAAGGLPIVGATAWQMLFRYGDLKRGQRVLVHGAGGAVGSIAVQLARFSGARVVATCRTRDVPFVAGLGAEMVIDTASQDFVELIGEVDLVVDPIGGEHQLRSFALLPPGGCIVSVVSQPDPALAAERRIRAHYFIVDVRADVLSELAELMAAGELRANVGEVLPLSAIRTAHEMLGGRPHQRGKITLDLVAGRNGQAP
jgi:NADPH:quinone reductase-like Zn-dependent oxidoreductase